MWQHARAAVLCVAMIACTNSSSYDPNWGADELAASGKADDLLHLAPMLTLGSPPRSGSVGEDDLDIYVMQLLAGDRIRVTVAVTDGTLNPQALLFWGTSTYVRSEDWSLADGRLSKIYQAPHGGLFTLAVRPYRNQGQGSYTVQLECLGGPCNGEFVEPVPGEFEVDEYAACIDAARICALQRLPVYRGAVGEVRANQIFTECLAMASSDGRSCAAACDSTVLEGEAATLCESIVEQLPFFADQDGDCLHQFDSCWTDCTKLGEDSGGTGEFWDEPTVNCWSGLFNGDCVAYAREHADCGGIEYSAGTAAECEALCRSTDGAWVDDLDLLCDEGCYHVCHDHVVTCGDRCADNDDECRTCVYEIDPSCADLYRWHYNE